MSVSEGYRTYIVEQLATLPELSTRRMFGGIGLYSDGLFFGLIDNDTLFFKVDETLAKRYRDKGMPPFAPIPGAKPMMGYYQVPPDVLEDADTLVRWARDSLAIPGKVKTRRSKVKGKLKS